MYLNTWRPDRGSWPFQNLESILSGSGAGLFFKMFEKIRPGWVSGLRLPLPGVLLNRLFFFSYKGFLVAQIVDAYWL